MLEINMLIIVVQISFSFMMKTHTID